MNRDIAAKWTAALRSGDYQQGKGALNRDGQFCCLGVLCELYNQENPGALEIAVEANGDISYNGRDDLPPRTVVGWADLGDKYGSIQTGESDRDGCSISLELTGVNDEGMDNRSFNFSDIADLIDYYVDEL